MFENYVVAKKTRQISPTLLGLAVMLMSSGLFGMVIYSWLKIEKLETPSSGLQVGLDLPPPPPPPKGGSKKKMEAKKPVEPKKVKPIDTVQPVKVEQKQEEPEPTEDDGDEGEGDPNGVEGGQQGGVVGGQLGGVVGGVQAPPPPPPPPPPPAPPQNVAPTALEASRISGEKNIVPDDVTKTEIQRSGKTRLVVPAKICLNASGTVKSANVLKSSGFPSYDKKIEREMRAWKYKPFMVNGTAAPVCSAVTFVYLQKN